MIHATTGNEAEDSVLYSIPPTLCVALLGPVVTQSPPNIQPSTNATLVVRYGYAFLASGVKLNPGRS